MLIGYARVSTAEPSLALQHDALAAAEGEPRPHPECDHGRRLDLREDAAPALPRPHGRVLD